jgi:membrane glycosyltransferase
MTSIASSAHQFPGQRRIFFRRLCLGVLTVLTTGAAAFQAMRVLALNGFGALEWLMLLLFVVLVFPIALSFWTAAFGFVLELIGKDSLALRREHAATVPVDHSQFRTAVVVPAHNEDTIRLFAGLKATYESAAETGCLPHFDFFVLSDTTDPDLWIREEMAFHELRQGVSDPERLFYRNRRENEERKAGNIADFCAHWGDRYRYMIVFDADSLMTGDALLNLVRLMERYPKVGIIQSPPIAVNRQSLFGRLMQFSARTYGPMLTKGLNFWHAGEANYWGHNAIIRLRPFVEHCRLPTLPGKAPLGGSILSHDFVEAALMRRAGWKVFLASDLEGSYEEVPANLIGHAARDRRWCQGNLQHARLLTMASLNWISRIHLALGVMSYVASPLWMLLLVLGTIEGLRMAFTEHSYFVPEESPFPVWQVSAFGEAILLFVSVMTLLILPKLLSLVSLLVKHRRSVARYGNPFKLTVSVLVEILFSVLIAPVLAVLHSRFVLGTLLGRNVEWSAQDRGDAETRLGEAFRRHSGITVLGLMWSALLLTGARELFWWFSPVLIGLVFSIPLSLWTSKVSVGRWARAWGLLLTPEEVDQPAILRRFHEELQLAARRPWAACRDGLSWVLHDPQVRSVHLALLPHSMPSGDPLTEHHMEGLRLKARELGGAALLPKEKRELLWDARSVLALSQQGSAVGR